MARGKKPAMRCHFCGRRTRRKARFGYMTFDVPCCRRCDWRG